MSKNKGKKGKNSPQIASINIVEAIGYGRYDLVVAKLPTMSTAELDKAYLIKKNGTTAMLTPLLAAVMADQVNMVLALLRKGVNVNTKSIATGGTVLTDAVQNMNIDTVLALLSYNIDTEIKDNSGKKAWQHAETLEIQKKFETIAKKSKLLTNFTDSFIENKNISLDFDTAKTFKQLYAPIDNLGLFCFMSRLEYLRSKEKCQLTNSDIEKLTDKLSLAIQKVLNSKEPVKFSLDFSDESNISDSKVKLESNNNSHNSHNEQKQEEDFKKNEDNQVVEEKSLVEKFGEVKISGEGSGEGSCFNELDTTY